jgi:multiple sugar transport system substrate-binding protein
MSRPGARFSRREALGGIGAVGSGALLASLLAACGAGPAPAAKAPAEAPKPAEPAQPAATTAPAAPPTAAPAAAAKPAAAGNEVLIKVSFGLDRNAATRQMLDMLTEKQPNIKSELVERPTGAQAVYDYYATAFSSGDSSLDVVSIDVIWPTSFGAAKWVIPLNDVFPPEEQKKYLDSMIWAMTVQDKIYGIPWYNDVGNMYYRKDLLEKAGVEYPKTWPELVEAAKKLQSPPDVYGIGYTMRQDEQLMCNFVEFIWSNGGDILDDQGKVVVNSPQNAEALDFMVNLVSTANVLQPGSLNMILDEVRQLFTEGKAVFHRNWNYVWAVAQGPESKVKDQVVQTRIPYFAGHGKSYVALGGWNYAVSALSKNREQAIQVAQWLGSYDMQKFRYIHGTEPPAIKAVYEDPEVIQARPQAPTIYEVAQTSRARPKHARYREFSEIVQTEIMLAITGKKSATDALATMDQGLNKLGSPYDPGIGR